MFNKFFGLFSNDMGIDLGTANVLVYVKGRGIVLREPSVVAINKKTDQVLAIGNAAKKLVGRTPSHIVASLLLNSITDFSNSLFSVSTLTSKKQKIIMAIYTDDDISYKDIGRRIRESLIQVWQKSGMWS